jgi:hypothetical protein
MKSRDTECTWLYFAKRPGYFHRDPLDFSSRGDGKGNIPIVPASFSEIWRQEKSGMCPISSSDAPFPAGCGAITCPDRRPWA